jgi:hypothetical protein
MSYHSPFKGTVRRDLKGGEGCRKWYQSIGFFKEPRTTLCFKKLFIYIMAPFFLCSTLRGIPSIYTELLESLGQLQMTAI